MSKTMYDLLTNLLASIISGLGVWLWIRMQSWKNSKRKSSFFGISPEEKCLIVMDRYPKNPNTMSHKDIGVLVDAVSLVHEIKGTPYLAPFDQVLEPAGNTTEFCIGGPDSNERTQSHLNNFLLGVQARLFTDQETPLLIETRAEKFPFENREKEYAILAKFYPSQNSKPVFLISGQTSFANRGAMYYLTQNYEKKLRRQYGNQPFCLIIRIKSPWSYGYKSAEIAKDISDTAFIPW